MPIIGGIGSLLGGVIAGNADKNAGSYIEQASQGATKAIGTAGNQAAQNTQTATNQAVTGVNQATTQGQQNVTNAANNANTVAGNLLGGQLQALSPYYAEGQQGTSNLQKLTANGGFQAPTAAQAAATPGEQFQLQQGLQGVEQQLGASGGAATGGALKALTQYGQNVASTYYQNAFNNSLNAYNTNVNTAMGMAGQGLQGAQLGQQASENFGNTYNNNTMGSAYYNAGLGMTGAQSAGQMGMLGSYEAGQQNMQGTEEASQFAMQGAQGMSEGIAGQGNALAGGIGGFANGLGASLMPGGGLFGGSTGGGYFGNPFNGAPSNLGGFNPLGSGSYASSGIDPLSMPGMAPQTNPVAPPAVGSNFQVSSMNPYFAPVAPPGQPQGSAGVYGGSGMPTPGGLYSNSYGGYS